ncbi:hypothetical protein CALCODRAFT_499202 [Calocera cornea HHB12733]|uniref:F-box domain-containing protein n=1 Tax=Calocera cornea HHB12733 TaxID=1353952 RepID=A0A165EJR2_9BASI|nr:hypothetical protein CALCODRAFT_499202 [Calocera cornea HHB12733]
MADFDFPTPSGDVERRPSLPGSFTSSSAFLTLPEEIHTHIFSFLPVPDMLAHGRVRPPLPCTYWESRMCGEQDYMLTPRSRPANCSTCNSPLPSSSNPT